MRSSSNAAAQLLGCAWALLALSGSVQAQTPAMPSSRWVVSDRDGSLSEAAEEALQAMLLELERARGVTVIFATLPWGGELEGFPIDGQAERSWGTLCCEHSRSLLLVVSGGRLEWAAGEDIADAVDAKVMTYIGAKHLSPLRPGGREEEHDIVKRMGRSLEILDAMLGGHTPASYYAWKVLEAPPHEPVNGGYQAFMVIGLRYVLALALMLPHLVLLALTARWILPKEGLGLGAKVLLQIAVVVALATAGMAVSITGEGAEFEPLLRYLFAASLFFLFSIPVHLLLVDRVVTGRGLPGWALATAYFLFPLAILVLAMGGGWRDSIERLNPFLRAAQR